MKKLMYFLLFASVYWFSLNSITYANSYSSSNNKADDQICIETFWRFSEVTEDWLCQCKEWYTWNDNGTLCTRITKEKWDEMCKDEYWVHSLYNETTAYCNCEEWYIFDLYSERMKCVKETFEQNTLNCTAQFGENTQYSTTNWECQCKDWYMMNEDYTKCVEVSDKQAEANCVARIENSHYSKEEQLCVCEEWYIFNEDYTKCVEDSVEQMKLNCPARYWDKSYYSITHKTCECPEWYVYDGELYKCLIDLSAKSIKTRLINTKDADCDKSNVILACSVDPLWEACPAVCLEMYDAINWMYANNLTIFNDPTKFWIYNKITREQASKFFVNFYNTVFNKKLVTNAENPFNDISNADPTLYDYILNANLLWLFKWSNWKFMPFNQLTKAQAIAVIIRMTTWLLDETQNPWYDNYLRRAESLKLLDNIYYSNNILDSEDIDRWDVALILYRLYDSLN